MNKPTYLVAKYVPNMARMEPRNVGVILWAGGGVASRFVDALDVPFIEEPDMYCQWVDHWQYLCGQSHIDVAGKKVSRRSSEFLRGLLANQDGSYLLYEAGYIAAEVSSSARDEAADYLFETLVQTPATNSIIAETESFADKCNSVFRDAGILDREEFRTAVQVELEITASNREPFKFDHAWQRQEIGALIQRVDLRRQPSTTNTAFLFEHAKKTDVAKGARRFALIDVGATLHDSVARSRQVMLSRLCDVVDVSVHARAVEQVSEVLSL